MGMVLCKKHGGQGFFEICEHIKQDLANDIYPEMFPFPIFNVKVCKACYDRVGSNQLPNISLIDLIYDSEMDDDQLDEIEKKATKKYRALNRVMLCTLCDKEKNIELARKNGKKDPFKAFENTLTYREKHIVDELKAYLLQNFIFEQSIVNTDVKALFISLGDISKPLLIKTYYVVEERKQEELLGFIHTFFESIEKTQCKIQFLEKEVWIETKGEKSTSYSRGEEKVIKEVLMK